MSSGEMVLVTGVYGFVGAHVAKAALEKGYSVRGTVRNFGSDKTLAAACGNPGPEKLELIKIDLDSGTQEEWDNAIRGCQYCLHVASPIVTQDIADPEIVLKPSIQGTRKIVQACANAKTVKKIVYCSSQSALIGGHGPDKTHFTPDDWCDDNSGNKLWVYEQAKMGAEKTAWELSKEFNIPLSTIIPTTIMGPPLLPRISESHELVEKLVQRKMPFFPNLNINCVDVRDVAEMHLLAMVSDKADGGRFIADAERLSVKEISTALQIGMDKRGWKTITCAGPYPLFWVFSFFVSRLRFTMPFFNKYSFDTRNCESVLGLKKWRPISSRPGECEGSLVETAVALESIGLLDQSRKNVFVAFAKSIVDGIKSFFK